MWHVLGQLIPIALAAALSMVPFTAMLFILLSEARRTTALPFLAGWILGTVSGLLLTSLVTQALPGRPRQLHSLIGTLEVVIGLALIALGALTLVMRARGAAARRRPSWIEGIGSFGPLPAFGIGLALNVRPKSILLFAAASLAIRDARVGLDDSLVLIVFYTVIATSTVAVPTVVAVMFPTWAEPRLLRARDWVGAHGTQITALVMILIGLIVMALGLGH